MTSIGDSEYPEMTISEAIKFAEAIKREKVQTLAGLAQILGIKSVRSGFFYTRISALTKYYGLVERNKNSVFLTTLAKRIVYPVSPQDRADAIRESILRVTLLGSLFTALGQSYHDLDFPAKLLELTHAKHEEVAEKGTKIERTYRDAAQYLGGPQPGQPTPEVSAAEEGLEEAAEKEGSVPPRGRLPTRGFGFVLPADERHWMYQDGDTVLRIEKNRKKVRIAIGMLKLWLDESPAEEGQSAGSASRDDLEGEGKPRAQPP